MPLVVKWTLKCLITKLLGFICGAVEDTINLDKVQMMKLSLILYRDILHG